MKKITVLISIVLLFAGCAKNETIIYGWPDSGDEDNDNSPNTENPLITFSATLENRAVTRAMSPMPKGIISQVYAFKTTDSRLKEPAADGLYTTASVGMLTGVKGYKMYLSNGAYNMYALSSNSSAAPPAVNNGETTPLQNGVDYLWWENTQQDILTSQVHIPIVFQHVSAQIVLDLSAGTGITLDSLVSATILPPIPGALLHLQFGVIDAATEYDTAPFEMGINKFLAQAIILPLIIDTPMALTLEILVNGETTPRSYVGNIPIPGKFAGGFSYVYSVVIDDNAVSFSDVNIKNWTEVDETGKPIYLNQ